LLLAGGAAVLEQVAVGPAVAAAAAALSRGHRPCQLNLIQWWSALAAQTETVLIQQLLLFQMLLAAVWGVMAVAQPYLVDQAVGVERQTGGLHLGALEHLVKVIQGGPEQAHATTSRVIEYTVAVAAAALVLKGQRVPIQYRHRALAETGAQG
jgi:hypothetical protein